MEPTFSSTVSLSSVTPELQAQIDAAVAALPAAHRQAPVKSEIVESKEAALEQLQNQAFTYGFAIAIESSSAKCMRFDCVHHKKSTKNSCKTPEDAWIRVETKTQSQNYNFELYISQQKRLSGQWSIGSTCLHHNHAPNPDPFQYIQHRSKQPGYSNALAAANTYSGVISYLASAAILRKDSLEIDRKQYNNLQRQASSSKELTRQAKLELLLRDLKREGLHLRSRTKYILDEQGLPTKQVIQDLFQMSLEQIKLARWFVSGFIYETNATFNTNCLKMPLSVMVDIDNTSKTFLIVYCYITLESTMSFKWIAEQLTDLAFYDCPKAALIYKDFSKGLRAAVAAKATSDLARTTPTNKVLSLETSVILDATQVVVGEATGKPAPVKLQLCEWYAIEAIKQKLVVAGRYKKDQQEEIIELIQAWVKAPDIGSLNKCRDELFKALDAKEQVYISRYYQDKEPQFC